MPPIYSETPQQIVKQKARRLALASNDRRGMESLPNPQHLNESFEVGKGKPSNESITPLRVGQGTGKYKLSQLEIDQLNEAQSQANSHKANPYPMKGPSPPLDDQGSKIGNISVGNNIQQKVAMNNFLTPIVFVSNNYHGVQPPVKGEYQEFFDLGI